MSGEQFAAPGLGMRSQKALVQWPPHYPRLLGRPSSQESPAAKQLLSLEVEGRGIVSCLHADLPHPPHQLPPPPRPQPWARPPPGLPPPPSRALWLFVTVASLSPHGSRIATLVFPEGVRLCLTPRSLHLCSFCPETPPTIGTRPWLSPSQSLGLS